MADLASENSVETATPDFDRGLFIAKKSGSELASLRRARLLAPTIGGMLFLPVIGLAYLFRLTLLAAGTAEGIATALAAVVGGVGLGFVFAGTLRSRPGRSEWTSFCKVSNTDTRYRVRAVIPPARRTPALAGWVGAAGFASTPSDRPSERAEDLSPVAGGFEPVIVRPWLGVSRPPVYWRTVWGLIAMLAACLIGVVFANGTAATLLEGPRVWGYAALIGGISLSVAESIWPVYLRLSPGRFDVFRYGPLGSGTPRVTSYDLRKAGVCVDFGPSIITIEPPRPPGEPAAKLVLSKKWPHFQEHAAGSRPEYISVALCPGRSAFCQQVIQAARTAEPTPPLPDDRLLD